MLWEIEIYDQDGNERWNKSFVGTVSDVFEFIDWFCKKYDIPKSKHDVLSGTQHE